MLKKLLLSFAFLLLAGLFGTTNTASASTIPPNLEPPRPEAHDGLQLGHGAKHVGPPPRVHVGSATIHLGKKNGPKPGGKPGPGRHPLQPKGPKHFGPIARLDGPQRPHAMPEPSAALAFAAGLLITGTACRRR